MAGPIAVLERLWLGLRTRLGIQRQAPAWQGAVRDGRARRRRAEEWVRTEGSGARLTPAGWLRVDEPVASLAEGASADEREPEMPKRR